MTAERLAYSVEEAAALLGIGKNLCYQGCRRGDIPSMRIGGRIVIPADALKSLLRKHQ